MKKGNIVLCALLILAAIPYQMNAQTTVHSDKEYQRNPYWMSMLDDPNANYFETVKAYTLYFEAHPMPKEEDDIIGMKGATETEKKHKGEWLRHLFSGKKEVSEQELAFAIKKYKFWCINVTPWVQDDGSILSAEQRLEILSKIRKP
jgi:hypothetical protein